MELLVVGVLGLAIGRLYVVVAPRLQGTLGATLLEFVATFGVWVLAEELHLSPILCVVAYAMVIAHYLPARQPPRDRVHSYSVWAAMVFFSNVIAFLLVGLQARTILSGMHGAALTHALAFAGTAMIVTALAPSYDFFMFYQTLVLTPMLLLSGVFFPITQLPAAAQHITLLLPLAHAVALIRPAMLGRPLDHPTLHLVVLAASPFDTPRQWKPLGH